MIRAQRNRSVRLYNECRGLEKRLIDIKRERLGLEIYEPKSARDRVNYALCNDNHQHSNNNTN